MNSYFFGLTTQMPLRFMAAMLAAFTLFCSNGSALAEDCPPKTGIEVIVEEAAGPDTLRLVDGRIVKLAGITIPDAAAADARLFLSRHVAGMEIRLFPLSAAPDRYGRWLARVVVFGEQGEEWAEERLIAAGLALANLNPGEKTCFSALRAAETKARSMRAGYWGVDQAMSLAASNRGEVAAAIGRFRVWEGKIYSVAIRDYAIFLDFGKDRQHDLMIMLPKRQRAEVEAVLGPMQSLEGRKVLVRGVTQNQNGRPRLRLTSADQLQAVED